MNLPNIKHPSTNMFLCFHAISSENIETLPVRETFPLTSRHLRFVLHPDQFQVYVLYWSSINRFLEDAWLFHVFPLHCEHMVRIPVLYDSGTPKFWRKLPHNSAWKLLNEIPTPDTGMPGEREGFLCCEKKTSEQNLPHLLKWICRGARLSYIPTLSTYFCVFHILYFLTFYSHGKPPVWVCLIVKGVSTKSVGKLWALLLGTHSQLHLAILYTCTIENFQVNSKLLVLLFPQKLK